MARFTADWHILDSFRSRLALPFPPKANNGTDNVDLLATITRTVMGKIPYTNINMLINHGRRPTTSQIIDDMLALTGGPCSVFNPFMNFYLRDYMGFDSSLVAAEMQGKMSHTAILVRLLNDNWLVDYGNGHPYLSPIRLARQQVYHHANFYYRVLPVNNEENIYAMQHRRFGTHYFTDFTFSTIAREHDHFDAMFEQHYRNLSFGHLLRCLRFARFPDNEIVSIRDQMLIYTKNGRRYSHRLNSDQAIIDAVQYHFPQAQYPIEKALNYLRGSL